MKIWFNQRVEAHGRPIDMAEDRSLSAQGSSGAVCGGSRGFRTVCANVYTLNPAPRADCTSRRFVGYARTGHFTPTAYVEYAIVASLMIVPRHGLVRRALPDHRPGINCRTLLRG